MKTLIGGGIAAFLGLIGIITWFDKFLYVIAGTVPLILILGGGVAIYVSFDELKELWDKKMGKKTAEAEPVSSFDKEKDEELEKYKQKVENLEKELDSLKKEKKEDDTAE